MIQTLKMCEKKNRQCFWAKKDGGCAWDLAGCFPVVDKCADCTNVFVDPCGVKYCSIFTCPKGQWAYGDCARATHLVKAEAEKAKVRNPLKASKKAKRGH